MGVFLFHIAKQHVEFWFTIILVAEWHQTVSRFSRVVCFRRRKDELCACVLQLVSNTDQLGQIDITLVDPTLLLNYFGADVYHKAIKICMIVTQRTAEGDLDRLY